MVESPDPISPDQKLLNPLLDLYI